MFPEWTTALLLRGRVSLMLESDGWTRSLNLDMDVEFWNVTQCFKLVGTKVLSNTIETNFQILSTKYAKFQPNIQIFEYSISCLVSYINHYFDTNKSK